MIIDNPIVELLPDVKPNSSQRPTDIQQSRQWESLSSLLLAFLKLLRIGEWHREAILSTPQEIPHRLGRRPRVLIQTFPPDNVDGLVYAPGGREAWDSRTITLASKADTTIEFLLF